MIEDVLATTLAAVIAATLSVVGWLARRVLLRLDEQDTILDNLDRRLTSHMAVEEVEARRRSAEITGITERLSRVEASIARVHERLDDLVMRRRHQ